MIASSVTIPGPDGSEIEVRLEVEKHTFSCIWLTVRRGTKTPPNSPPSNDMGVEWITLKLNRGSGLALSNILSGWASELPVWPAP